ncbi:hypothetical protein ACFT5B_05305 [Luteimicrobium sp. NPDC057192]|uniref:hypothetical protein n=1 Tax=Luteimicrobium sp. NPDC057192 TaxID=3346042 RepID=UPI0036356AFE
MPAGLRALGASLLAVGAVLALSGCSFVTGGDAQGSAGDASAATSPAPDAVGTARAVGPLKVAAPEYWVVEATKGGVTHVSAGGCPKGTACPGFDVVTGRAARSGADAVYLPKSATCPGAKALHAVAVTGGGAATSAPATVAGTDATRSVYALSCRDASGKEQYRAAQVQWSVPGAPGGPVLVVDRWAFEGLDARLEAARWA